MKEHFLELYAYEDWAMRKIIPLVEVSGDAEAARLFRHILLARQLWFNRVSGNDDQFVFDGIELEECIKAYERNQSKWVAYIDDIEEFDAMVEYKTLEGDLISSKLKGILTHVVNHSTYHRGQITAILKGKLKLESTDFIFFLRDG